MALHEQSILLLQIQALELEISHLRDLGKILKESSISILIRSDFEISDSETLAIFDNVQELPGVQQLVKLLIDKTIDKKQNKLIRLTDIKKSFQN